MTPVTVRQCVASVALRGGSTVRNINNARKTLLVDRSRRFTDEVTRRVYEQRQSTVDVTHACRDV
jgi:hypothetical protein